MAKRLRLGLCLTLGFTTACQNAGGLSTSDDGLFAPTGSYDLEESVDGLIVGHRLMEAGEYELALKAYQRAAGQQGFNVDTLSAIGSANLRLGRLGQAETDLRGATDLDQASPAAWNNLGVVLMERGNSGEAEQVFQLAFALDSGQSDSIRDNLRLAIAKNQIPDYDDSNNEEFELVRRGYGEYLLLSTP
ncbi:tetratricopeptide repeat protein [Cochlodiniinecator piscidefendens]|uniref:tetratricopeptide repeat protein n=1 Tax=Cochlodiniinecator piscidefendens TaxID=2715756 RepID=UPI00140A0630|nr:tetratricopeptide repeat protein [Cochlodiniinecator piscidefendens]